MVLARADNSGVAMSASPEVTDRQGRWQIGRRWIITVAATSASTWLLEMIAAGTGVLLVATHVLDGIGFGWLIGVLIVSDLLWALGMRVNLAANWRLLEATGTSTNAFSKAGYDLAARRSASGRRRRFAGSAGYIFSELVKEALYFLGAFGAAAVGDDITSHDALVFLVGVNVGAAGYEFAVGRLTSWALVAASRRAAG